MPLSKEEQETLEALQRKAEEPEPAANGRSENVSITIDLGDENQVKRALKMGYLQKGDLDEFDEPEPEGEEKPEEEEPPRRRQRYE